VFTSLEISGKTERKALESTREREENGVILNSVHD
jgi:hypothetical protein